MKIELSKLPKHIYDQLPMSIKVLKDEYHIDEFPQHLKMKIKDIYDREHGVLYNQSFDVHPELSQYNDLKTIDRIFELIVTRLQSFFYTLPDHYPFNAVIGCRLQYYLQTRQTTSRDLLIAEEIDRVISTVNDDTTQKIEVLERSIDDTTHLNQVIYDVNIKLKINESVRTLSMQF